MYLKHFGSELVANGLHLNGKRVYKCNYAQETKADFNGALLFTQQTPL